MYTYKVLSKQVFSSGKIDLVPIRFEDQVLIMKWRNEQINHLRQAELLTVEKQDVYFKEVVSKLFDQDQPNQILFSYLQGDRCMGYGGLVHINWVDKNAEISFIMDTKLEKESFELHWVSFLGIIRQVAFMELELHKVFTYAFDLRPRLYLALENAGMKQEAVLPEHCFYHSKYIDVVIHALYNKELILVLATLGDVKQTFSWATNTLVRQFALSKSTISFVDHNKWFAGKLVDENCHYYLAHYKNQVVGSFRLDVHPNGIAVISYLLDPAFHGLGLGRKLLVEGIDIAGRIDKVKSLQGEVLIGNTPSVKIFESLGFELLGSIKGLNRYQLKLK